MRIRLSRRVALAAPICALAGLFATVAQAQTEPVQDIRPTELRTHAIVGATVVVKPGQIIENATVVIDDGVIQAVGTDVRIPASAKRWDGKGLTVYAGLIDPAVLIEAEAPTGAGAHWNPAIHSQVNIAELPAPEEALRQELRSQGITAAAFYPASGILRGSGAVLATSAGAEAKSYLDRAMMAAALDRGGRGGYPGSLMGSIALTRQSLYDSQWYAQSEKVYHDYPEGNEPPIRADALAAMRDVITGQQKVLFDVSDELNALRAARIADEFDLNAVLLGSGYEFRRLREIAETGLPVIVPVRFPEAPNADTLSQADSLTLRELETWEQAPTNARRLADAGVTIALTTNRLNNRGEFFSAVRSAIRHGLSEEAALAAVTTTPATMLGLDHIMGTIEPGKLANLVVVDGKLFDREANILDTWIDGRRHEINPRPGPKIVGLGTLHTDSGLQAPVTINTERNAVTVSLSDDDTARAREVSFENDRLTFLIEGRVFGVEGYVHLSGAHTGDSITGMGLLPNGDRFAFEIADIHEDESAESVTPGGVGGNRGAGGGRGGRGGGFAGRGQGRGQGQGQGRQGRGQGRGPGRGAGAFGQNAPARPADDGVSGTWKASLMGDQVPPESRDFDLILELSEDGTRLSGSTVSPAFSAELSNGKYDPQARTGELTLNSEEFNAGVSFTIDGDNLDGTIDAGDMSMNFRAVRVSRGRAGDDTAGGATDRDEDANFVMPPDQLEYPLGAYGLPDPPGQQNVAVINGTIWTSGPRGVIERGWMTVQDGKVTGVGEGDFIYSGPIRWDIIDATGKHVTPGLIDCHSHTGISGGVNEMGQTITAEVRVQDVIDPDDINWYRQLAGGLTAANQLHGSANPIGGQNSVVKLKWGGSPSDFPIQGAIPGIKFALGENVIRSQGRYPNTRMGVEAVYRDIFTAAREYETEWKRYDALPGARKARTMPPRRDLELDTLVEILNGDRLVHCHSYRQDEILMLIRVADDFGFTVGTFQHVLEGYKIAEAIAAHGAGASTFSDWWAYKMEVMDAIPYNGSLMNEVGVVVSFNSDSDELARRMNTEAAKAVRYGKTEPAEALKFVTLNPAKQLRIDNRVGSLETGKDGDFVIWSGDPLSTYTKCEQTWIEGARYFDLERDQQLREHTKQERKRLIQKLLASKLGDAPSASTEEDNTDTTIHAEVN